MRTATPVVACIALVAGAGLLALPDTAARADDPHAGAAHHGHGDNPHLRMTASRPVTAEDTARYQALEARIRQDLGRYRDVAVAVAEGYAPFRPDVPQRVLHYSKRRNALAAAIAFDPLRPTSLLYRRERDGGYTLTGVMYTAPAWFEESDLDARVPLSVAPWHQHVNLCLPAWREEERWSETRDGRPVFGPRSPIATEAECESVGGRFVARRAGWMVHVEAFDAG